MAEEKNYTIIALALETRKEIEALVGVRNLNSFIVEAVERELGRRTQATLRAAQIQQQERVFIN